MPAPSWVRRLFVRPRAGTISKPVRPARKPLRFEQFEDRVVPTGGLTAWISPDQSLVKLNPGTPNEISLSGATTADRQGLATFFSSPDGQATPQFVAATLTAGGQTMTGAFSLSEFAGGKSGVAVGAGGASVTLGTNAGIRLTGADGAFALLSSGAAGVLSAADTGASAVDVVGLTGLDLNSTTGMTYRLNSTGAAVNKAVTIAGNSIPINFPDGKSVNQIDGAADFRIKGASGTLARFGGKFVVTDAVGKLSLAASQLTTDIYTGTVRALTIGSVTAGFTLDSTAFSLASPLPVNDFFPLPVGIPIGANEGNYSPTGGLTGFNVPLGPLQIVKLAPVVNAVSFGPAGLNLNVGLSADSASLTFGKAGSSKDDKSIYAAATNLTGTFGLAGSVDPVTGVVSKLTAPGNFQVTAATFDLNVPKVLKGSATDLSITYDPSISGPQQLVTAKTVTVSVPAIGLEGAFTPSDTTPGLVVYTDGFAFGDGKVSYTKDVKFGSVATISNPFVRLGNFSYRNSTGASLGSFGVGATKVEIQGFGDKFKMSGEELEAKVTFGENNHVDKFTLSAGRLTAEFGDYVTIEATGLEFTPTAQGSETLLKLDTGFAKFSVPQIGLSLDGTVEPLSVAGDGTITGPETLRLGLRFVASDATSLRWPAVLPIAINRLELFWPHFRDDPKKFTIELSAGIDADFGGVSGLRVSGGVDHVVIDPYLLADKSANPIVSIDGFSARVSGNMFGGKVEAGVVVGIINLDAEGNTVPYAESAKHVWYGAFQGGFTFANMETELRLGFSDRGFLQGYIGAPTKIVLDPISGLNISQLRGAITFNAPSLVKPASPEDLAAPDYKPTASLTADEWAAQLKQSAINQVTEGSRIFTIEDNLVDVGNALRAGTVEFGTDNALLKAFDDANYELASEGNPAEIVTLVPGQQWRLSHQGLDYIVEKTSSGTYDVTKTQFTLPDSSLWTSLAAGVVSPAVVAAFAANSIVLDPAAIVSSAVIANGDVTKWRIEAGGVKYFVTKRAAELAITGGGGDFGAARNLVRVEIGATLTTYAPSEAFVADVDIIVSSEGRFLVVGKAVIAEKLKADVRMFFDLSQVGRPHPEDPLSILFLADIGQPETTGQSTGKKESAPVRLSGAMTFEFLDTAGNLMNPLFGGTPAAFRFRLLGRGEVEPTKFAKLIFGGDKVLSGDAGSDDIGYAELSLLISDVGGTKSVKVDVSGSLSVEGLINAHDVLSAAGTLILEKPADGPFTVIGGVKLDFDATSTGLSFLKNAGLTAAQADLTLGLNSAAETKELTLHLPGRDEETLVLAPTSLTLVGTGKLQFDAGVSKFGADLGFDGAFAARVSIDSVAPSEPSPDFTQRGDGGLDIDLFLAARLDYGLKAGGDRFNLFTVDGMGLLAIRDVGAVDPVNHTAITPTIAGRLDLFFQRGIPGLFKVEGSAQLLLNTSGREFNYIIPDSILPTIQSIQARRLDIPIDQVTLPDLPTVDGHTVAQLPAALPNVLPGENNAAGPYFSLMLGDVSEPAGSTGDSNNNGLVNVSLTVANSIKLTGAARVAVSNNGFALAINSMASIALPGAENLFRSAATGSLVVGPAGLVGALTFNSNLNLNIPGLPLAAGLQAVIGVNTTGQAVTVSSIPNTFNQTLPARSGTLLVNGQITAGGFKLRGKFGISVSGESLQMLVDAGLDVFNLANVHVSAKAAIYYGTNPGLVLDATLGAGLKLAAPGLTFFEIGADLKLSFDSRTSNRKFEIAIQNARVNLLDVFEATGSGRIVASGDYFRVEGSFSGSLLGIIRTNASGFFDSLGNFGLDLDSRFQLGSDDWGIRAGGWIHILRDTTLPTPIYLSVSAGLYGEVRAAGITLLGANIRADYNAPQADYNAPPSGDGRLRAQAKVTILFVDITVKFTLGYISLNSQPLPALGAVDGTTLMLNVGARGRLRSAGLDENNNPEADEAYTIESIGPGSRVGERVRVRAFGSSQVYDNIENVTGDFGDGNDQLILAPSFGTYRSMNVTMMGGAGDDILSNQSSARAILRGGDGDDLLLSTATADLLDGGAGNDTLSGGPQATLLGGDGNDSLSWQVGAGQPIIDGGAGSDTFSVYATNAPENISLSGSAAGATIAVAGLPTYVVAGIETIKLFGRGGADTLRTDVAGLSVAGVSRVDADLSQIQGQPVAGNDSYNAVMIDDGASDRVTLVGTSGDDTIALSTSGGDLTATVNSGFTFNLRTPNAKQDTITVDAAGGNDKLTATAAAATATAGLVLLGGDGNDTATLPLMNATFDGGAGANTLTVLPPDGDRVTVTNAKVAGVRATVAYANVAALTVGAGDQADVTVQSTTAAGVALQLNNFSSLTVNGSSGPVTASLGGLVTINNTGGPLTVNQTRGQATVNGTSAAQSTFNLSGGASLLVNGNTGPLSVVLADAADTAITLAATSGPVDVSVAKNVTAGTGTRVNVGAGLLARVAGSVSVSGVPNIVYDDSADGANQSLQLTNDGLSGGGAGQISVSGANRFKLRTGLGDDSVTAAVTTGTSATQPILAVEDAGGTDSYAVQLTGDPAALGSSDPALGAVFQASGVEQVSFASLGSRPNTTWLAATGSLASGGRSLFSYGPATADISLGDASDTVAVTGTIGSTTIDLGNGADAVTVGGGNLAGLAGSLTLRNSGNSATLILDDSLSPAGQASNDTRPLVVTPTSVTSVGQTIRYAASGYSSLGLLLGAANDRIAIGGAMPASNVVAGAGDDQLTVTLGSGNLTFDAGAGNDILNLDRSDAMQALTGSLDGTGSVTLSGLPNVTTAAGGSPAEYLRVQLGSGNDSFQVDSAGYNPAGVSLIGGAGDDTVTVRSVGGSAGTFLVLGDTELSTSGDTAQNTVTLVAPSPVAGQFAPIVPRVQKVVVDHTDGTAPVAWTQAGTKVLVPGGTLVDADGANLINVLGQPAGGDTLTVSGTTASRPVTATLNGNRVDLNEGLSVLSQTTPTVAGPSSQTTVSGLSGASVVTTTADGKLVFALGTDGIGVFRATQPSVQLTFLRRTSLPAGGIRSIAADPTGIRLYAVDSNGLFSYAVNQSTGELTAGGYVVVGNAIQLAVSPDGQLVSAFFDGGPGNRRLVTATTSVFSGQSFQTVPDSITGPVKMTFSEDSNQLLITGASNNTAIFQRSGLGYTYSRMVVSNDPTISFSRYTTLQLSEDGQFLFGQNGGSLDYFKFDANGSPIRLGTISGVQGGWGSDRNQTFYIPTDQFQYDSRTGKLVVIGGFAATDRNVYRFDTGTQTFVFDRTLAAPSGTPSNLYASINSVGVGRGTDANSTYSVWTSYVNGQVQGNGGPAIGRASALSWNNLDDLSTPTRGLTSTFVYDFNDAAAPGYLDQYLFGDVIADASGAARILTVRQHSTHPGGGSIQTPALSIFQSQEFVIYDPRNANKITNLATASNQVLFMAVVPGNGPASNAWWTLEYGQSGYSLNSYRLTVVGNNPTILRTGTRTMAQLGLPEINATGRIRFSPDGQYANFIPTLNNAGTVYQLTVGSGGTLPTSGNGSQIIFTDANPQNINSLDLAVGTTYAYASTTNGLGGSQMTRLKVSNAVFDRAQDLPYYFSVPVTSTEIGSTNQNVLVNSAGKLLRLTPSANSTTYSLADSLNLGSDYASATIRRVGSRLLVGGQKMALVNIGTTAGSTMSLIQAVGYPGQLTASSASSFQLAGGLLAAVVPGDNLLSAIDYSNPTTLQTGNTAASLRQGANQFRSFTSVTTSAASPDGRFLYAYSAADKAVAVYDRNNAAWTTFFEGSELPAGALTGSVGIVTTQSGSTATALLLTSSGTYVRFTSTSAGTTTATVVNSLPGQVGSPLALAYSSTPLPNFAGSTGTLYVSTNNGYLSAIPMGSGLQPTGGVANMQWSHNLTALRVSGGQLYAVSSNNLEAFALDFSHVSTGTLTNIADVIVRDGSIYAVSNDGILRVLTDNAGVLSVRTTYQNGVNGVSGIGGATDMELSADGAYLFVAGRTDNAVAVFLRDPATGLLTFVQVARNGRTASGIAQPTGLAYLPDGHLAVASGTTNTGVNGGFAILDVSPIGGARPANVRTTFQAMSAVTLQGGNDSDTLRLLAAPTPVNGLPVTLTLNGDAGGDIITVSDVGPAGNSLSIDAGAGDDLVTIDAALPQSGVGRVVTVVGGSGNDEISIQKVSSGTSVNVNLAQGGSDIDVVRVRGAGVPTDSNVTVSGDLATGSGSSFAGDALIYDGQNATLSSNSTTGGISLTGQGPVTYAGLYAANPQQVFLIAAPRPTVTLPAINEGQSVTLSAADASGQANVTYSWDLNGDGDFGDASGQSITLTWDQLKTFGITGGPRNYPVAVRATSSQNAVVFGGRSFQLSADAAGLLVVGDTAPTLAAIGGTATLGVSFALPLSASDPGDDRVSQWSVNWGDGTSELFGADATSASHIYGRPGDFVVLVTATNEDGNFSRTGRVQVRPGVGSVTLDGPYSLLEGNGLTATAVVFGSPTRYEWDFGANGTVDVITTGPSLTSSWTDLAAFGITDNGSYLLKVTAVYTESGVNYPAPSAAVSLTVGNTAPTGTLTPSTASALQGTTVSIRIVGYSDPASADTQSSATVDYDFDNNGTIDLAGQPVGSAVEIPAAYRSSPGQKTVRAVLRDKDGGARQLFASYVVTPATPTVSIAAVSPINEGGMASLTASVSDPGGLSVSGWRVNWGDGTADNVTNTQLGQTFTHRYADNSNYPVTVTAITSAGDISADTVVIVQDVAPTVTLTGSSSTVQGAATAYTVTLAVTDLGTDVVSSMVIAWGDGTTDTLPGDATSASHTYTTVPTGGLASVRVTTLTNDDGTFTNPSMPLSVAVSNAGPSIRTDLLTVPANGFEGGRIDLSATAVSVATGWEPLTFAWTVTGPTGATVASLTRTSNPVSFGSLSATTDAIGVRLLAGAVDALGGDLTVTWTLTPSSGSAITFTGSDVSFTPLDGVYSLALTATSSHGTAVASGTLTVSNGLPTLANVIVSDVDTDANVVTDFQFATRSGLSFTPIENGTYTVTLTVTDADGGSASIVRTVDVANVAPAITSFVVPSSGIAGQPLTFSATASDPGGVNDPLTFTWTVTDLSTGNVVATLNGASVNYTPTGISYGVQLDVTDGDGGTDSRSTRLDVTTPAPTIPAVGFNVPTTGVEGGSASFSVTVVSPTSPAPTVQWKVQGPSGPVVFLDGTTVQYTWPRPGTYTVTAIAMDRFGTSVSRSATVSVSNVNPTITGFTLPTTGWFEGVGRLLNATATDPGADETLRFLWTFTPASGTATQLGGSAPTFVPANNGVYSVRLTVSDENGGSTTSNLGNITVANVAPVVGNLTVPSGLSEGQTVRLTAPTVTDVAADLPGITYTWIVMAPSGSAQNYTGQVVDVLLPDSGIYTVQLAVADVDGGRVVTPTQPLNVANVPPVLTATTIPTRGYVGKPVALSASASDVPTDILTYTWTVTGPTGITTLTGSAPSFTPTSVGSYLVSLVVRDKDGGTATVSGTITVVASPVSISTVTIPTAGSEGSTVNLSAIAADELGGLLTYTWTITPTGGTAFTRTGSNVSFVPSDDSIYQVSLTVSSLNGSATAVSNVAVANLPPVITRVTVPANSTAALPVTLSATATDPAGAADPLTYTWTITSPSGTPLTFTGPNVTFTPVATGLYEVRLSVTDGDGGTATARTLLPVVNAPPVARAGGPYTVTEGSNVALSAATSTDPNQSSSSLQYAWDLDGNGVYGEASTPFGDERGVAPTFNALNLDGPTSRTVKVRVTDAYGATDFSTATINVTNVAPTVKPLTLSASAIDENGTVTVNSTFTDPGLADTHTVTLVWGDGTPNTVLTLALGSRSFSATHRYLDNPAGQPNGQFTITATVTDDDGGSSSAATAVTVRNVAPLNLAISGRTTSVPGLATPYTGTFTDPGTLDTWTQSWTVAKSTALTTVIASGTGAGFSFTPPAVGSYVVTFTVTDKDGGVSRVSMTLTVTPTAVINGVLYVGGTSLDDDIDLSRSGSNIRVDIRNNTCTTYLVPATGITKVVVFALAGNDDVEVECGWGTLPTEQYGGDGNDELSGGDGNDLLDGGAGNDELCADLGNDTLLGGDGDDRLWAGRGNDLLDGGAGNDTLIGRSGNDILRGGAGNDVLTGGSGSDQLFGEDGNDTLTGGCGGDVLDGGSGNDVIRAGSGGDTIFGGAGDDLLYAGSGNDQVNGGDGNDTIFGGSGCDVLDGGAGNDVITAGSGGDTVYGGSGNDTIYGGSGADRLDGGDGDDIITGGSGNDTILGGAGNDRLDGESGNDMVDGGAGNDTLVGGSGADTLLGSDGDDVFVGWGGVFVDDNLNGGTGTDRIDAGGDWGSLSLATFGPTLGIELIAGTAGRTSWIDGTSGNNTLDFSATELRSLSYVDGGAGNDLIVASPFGTGLEYRGGSGNDTLVSSLAADRLRGDSGADVFRITTWTNGGTADQLLDFSKGSDKIDLSQLGIRASDTRTVTRSGGDTILTINLPPLNGQPRSLSLRLVNYTGTLDTNDFLFAA